MAIIGIIWSPCAAITGNPSVSSSACTGPHQTSHCWLFMWGNPRLTGVFPSQMPVLQKVFSCHVHTRYELMLGIYSNAHLLLRNGHPAGIRPRFICGDCLISTGLFHPNCNWRIETGSTLRFYFIAINIWICLDNFDGLVQERRNYIANALELRISCTYP